MEYYVLMEKNKIHCIFHTLKDVLGWTPLSIIVRDLELHRVRYSDGKFTTQIIGIRPEIYVPLGQAQQPYLLFEGVSDVRYNDMFASQ